MNPRHIKQIKDSNRIANAPYNFIELPNKVVPAKLPLSSDNNYDSERYTGQINCTLTTSSPLYIRCGYTPSDFKKYEGKADDELTEEQKKQWEQEKRKILASFYSYPDNYYPTVPGSSIRGMIRSLIEIISFSKIDQIADKQLIYRAFADITSLGTFYRNRLLKEAEQESSEDAQHRYLFLMQAGYLIQRGSKWVIQPAKELVSGASFARIRIKDISKLVKRSWHNIKHARKVSISVKPLAWHPCREGYIQLYYAQATPPLNQNISSGVLVETGGMPNKKKLECVFGLPDEEANLIPIPDDFDYSIIQEYQEQITKEQIKVLGKDGALKSMHPIFYLVEDGKLIFFGHTMMFRLPYKQSIKEFIPKNLYNSENQQVKVDITEAIFGFISRNKKGQGQAGRVFFSDAKCHNNVDEDIWLSGNKTKSMTPKILATPKPTTFQHYLVQDSENENDLKHYASEPEKETVIRGHKLYWHKPNIKRKDIEEINTVEMEKSSSQYTKIKPIKPDVSFNFNIHFENLNNIELGAILWILKISAKPEYCLSLGMGKPLGMGAIKIEHELLLNKRHERYYKLFNNNQWLTGGENQDNTKSESESCIKAFKDYILKNIHEDDHPEAFNATELDEIPRIQTLLLMLRCDNPPSADDTRYMEISRKQEPCVGGLKRNRKGTNEYSKRPILPTPLQVKLDSESQESSSNTNSATARPPKPKKRPKK
ncbi:hypothetical protein NIES267_72440 (plasmid) [Calothrix parasitica NIES-267]|uniref:CRISPR type III-associated protein domain-containing protein n=1 Tax=Calothrix parasitica NIES-267 TaxID=1973488 RepID=A0A1Z4M2M3_9CYAN|nr:hypothetical protein NIES267_72440 [Calothrix parasitica NIES-267]